MPEKNIEVEIRSFISKEQYEKLLEFLKENSESVKEDFQETHYFDSEEDLRIQKNNHGAKIWMKKGKIHDDFRKEIEIKINKEDFNKTKDIFSSLGFCTEIMWLRDRKQFNWQDIKVCLDYTKGYGYIIELEKMSSEEEKEKTLNELKQKLRELDIPLTSKEEFEKKFKYYKENWKGLILKK
ncbi:MAG TPA: CYTH domain-containing protein [Candidatus Pacearchaeota archaeon]|nr:CYTH domain protein [archaeon BMS3Abin17]HDK42736.1 CYTH domain-containing protein [Candidatus Pacearchaeota archaeon]HDZ61295.1 CYTH domain-containing protein [Candidatus Pacearchaeota archaeon]